MDMASYYLPKQAQNGLNYGYLVVEGRIPTTRAGAESYLKWLQEQKHEGISAKFIPMSEGDDKTDICEKES